MTKSFDLIITGIGGKGTILGDACLIESGTVKGTETHGMAQRGGSVECHIRIDGRYSPLISPGQADLLISLDLLEAHRYSHFLIPGGKAVSNRCMVLPTSVFTQSMDTPGEDEIITRLARFSPCIVDADRIAAVAGSPLTQNVVMLGAASDAIPLQNESLVKAIRQLVPKKTIDINVRAFEMGRDAGKVR